MTKDYAVIRKEKLTVLGHKVIAVTEIFSDGYLADKCFEPRCFRCCFFKDRNVTPQSGYGVFHICNYIKCDGGRGDVATHFELDE